MNNAKTMTIMMLLLLTVSGTSASADEQDAPKKQDPTKAEPKTTLENGAQDAKPQPKEEPAITVSLKDGIHFRSSDGNLDSTLGGYAGIHYRFTAHRPNDNTRTLPDSWFIRQLRPELSGTVYKDFDFRVQLDIPSGNGLAANPSASTGTVQDAYIGWRYYPEFSLRIGQFKEPFGQEQGTPDRYLEFDERSEGDRFVPQRDLGAMVYGRLFDGILGYEAGYFNGNGRGVTDANKGKEFAARIRVAPFATAADGSLFKLLRLGVAGTAGTVQRQAANSSSALDVSSAYLGILYLDSTAGFLDGERKRGGVEMTWNYGPVGVRAETWRRSDGIDNGAFNNERLTYTAWNASVTWLVTGEKKPIEGRIIPQESFDPRGGGWGALELAARVDRLHIGNEIFTTGVASPVGNSNVVTGYTFGVNWYLNRHIRISPNIVWEVFDDPILFATGRTDRHFFGGILRFQLEF
jgi:phosphate-selective porin OprO/OprP